MPYYMFYWNDGDDDERFMMYIEANSKTVKKLLNEYRSSDPRGYNNFDWLDFLRKKKIKAEIIEPAEWIYF